MRAILVRAAVDWTHKQEQKSALVARICCSTLGGIAFSRVGNQSCGPGCSVGTQAFFYFFESAMLAETYSQVSCPGHRASKRL